MPFSPRRRVHQRYYELLPNFLLFLLPAAAASCPKWGIDSRGRVFWLAGIEEDDVLFITPTHMTPKLTQSKQTISRITIIIFGGKKQNTTEGADGRRGREGT